MINARLAEEEFRRQGLAVEKGRDEPDTHYPPHAHEQTRLYTVAGSLALTVEDEEPVTLEPGSTYTIPTGVNHEAVVGPNGWKYVAAWNAAEAAAWAAEHPETGLQNPNPTL